MYGDLLAHFWSIHDPTEKDRQGPDIGTNYRSVIFYHDPEQKQIAIRSKEELHILPVYKAGVTEIIPATVFWRAEEYHQQYHEKHGGAVCGRR